MESDSNSEATQFVSEMQEGIGHAHSRDLEPSNSSESERFHDEYKSSSDVLKHSSACPTPTSETSPIASDNLIIIKPENQAVPTEETKSTEVNQPALSDKTGSPETNQPSLSTKTGSSEVNQTALSEKTGSKEANQPALPENTESETFCEKLESAESNQPTIDEETELDEDILDDNSEYFSDYQETDTDVDFIDFKKLHSNYLNEIPLEKVREYLVESSNFENFSSSLRPVAKPEGFSTRLNKGKKVIETPNGYVIVNTHPPYQPIFPSFEMPPLSPPKKYSSKECVQVFTPARELEVPGDLYLKITLKSLFCMFKDLVEKGLKKYSDCSKQPAVVDVIDNSKKELGYGIYFLQQMNNRIYALLKAVDGLPDSMFFTCKSQRSISVRTSLRDAGFKLQQKIQNIEFEAKEDHEKFIAVFRRDEKCKSEFDKEVLAGAVSKMFRESLEHVSTNFATLETDIQNFRNKIHLFTTEIESLMNRIKIQSF